MPVNRRPSPSATDPGKRDPDVTFRTTPPAAKVRRAVPRPRPVQIEQPIVERSLRPTMAKRAPSGKAAEPSISLTFDKDPLINGVVYSVVLGKPKGLDKPDYEFPA